MKNNIKYKIENGKVKRKNTKGYGRDAEDLTGKRFSSLLVIGVSKETDNKNHIKWDCLCDCGVIKSCYAGSLKHGGNKSCGCKRYKHGAVLGESSTRLYHIWNTMIHRCNNKKSSGYKIYGAKGIKVCLKWRNSFFSFKEWALNNGYLDNLTLDRYPNKNGDYSPENCRWATMKQQQNNRTNNTFYLYNGCFFTASQLADIANIPLSCMSQRLYKLKWSVEKSITTPFIPVSDRYKFRKK